MGELTALLELALIKMELELENTELLIWLDCMEDTELDNTSIELLLRLELLE